MIHTSEGEIVKVKIELDVDALRDLSEKMFQLDIPEEEISDLNEHLHLVAVQLKDILNKGLLMRPYMIMMVYLLASALHRVSLIQNRASKMYKSEQANRAMTFLNTHSQNFASEEPV